MFNTIDWSSGNYYLKVEVDINNLGSYAISGTSLIASVPYAVFAGNANSADALAAMNAKAGDLLVWDGTKWTPTPGGSGAYQWKELNQNIYATHAGNVGIGTDTPLGKLEVKGSSSDPNVALFEVKDKNGNPIFSVYPTGVEIIYDETAPSRGAKGGFAVSGRNSTRVVKDILRVTTDSTTVYVSNSSGRPAKGGFAVSGRNSTRIAGNDILRVTPDSTRIYTSDPSKGFGVGQTGTRSTDSYLKMLPDNYFIGHQSGILTTGKYNTFFGYTAGRSNTTGASNIFVGYEAGKSNTEGLFNVFVGNECGKANTTGEANVFVGRQSGNSNTTGAFNVFIGELSGGGNTSGENNTFIGQGAGGSNTTGQDNIFLGRGAGTKSKTTLGNIFIGRYTGYSHIEGWGNIFMGHLAAVNLDNGAENLIMGIKAGGEKGWGNRNVFLGAFSGQNNYVGDENVFIGSRAGINATGSNNLFIGTNAGADEVLSNKLYITNTNTDTLIYGDFSSKQLVINGSSANLSRDYNFWVNGTAGGANPWFSSSDLRLKKSIQTIPNALDKVLKLRGVNFEWRDNAKPGLNVGFIAQEVLSVVPEVVKGSEQATYTMDYASLSAVIVEAMKEQQKTIEQLKAENEALKKQMEEIKKLVMDMKK